MIKLLKQKIMMKFFLIHTTTYAMTMNQKNTLASQAQMVKQQQDFILKNYLDRKVYLLEQMKTNYFLK